MLAARPFRWLLTLTALVIPAFAATCREGGLRQASPVKPEATSSVVFRHYI
ncbi:hypothetical protein J2X36_000865 [Methylobacterium sp. BE186]|uniref:hypothetical protein n=1 Tax=Methylobacterium sp. BE186 TaxID=2817715 RepID=UPI00285A108F|nr:hypothetical protein [Methylobacterium sp. BE186]MDR7036127.1 hypothetical protein [Methylobacterium sp. BE186]